jgi:hypothetical protein
VYHKGSSTLGRSLEFLEALLAPREVVELLDRRLFHGVAHVVEPRRERLALVEALRHDLAGVVDAHQAGGMAALAVGHRRLGNAFGRVGARCGGRRRQHGAHRLVELLEDARSMGSVVACSWRLF